MKLIYLYTTLNWYRIDLFKSIAKLMDLHVYILNGGSVSYEGISFKPNTEGLNITFLSKEESEADNLCKIIDKETFDGIVVPSMNSVYTLNLTTKVSHYYSKKGKTVLYFWEYWPLDIRKRTFSKVVKQSVRHFYTCLNRGSITYFITPGINTYSFYQRMNIPSEKLLRCHNVSLLSMEGVSSQTVREELGIPEEDKVILFFGRSEAYKGCAELIQAFLKLNQSNWHLLICGPGFDWARKYSEKQSNIHLTGSIPTDQRAKYFAAANIFVLANTYKKKIEAWGLTVNEAMQCGLPILATNATGSAIDLVFSGVNGYVLDANRLETELPFYLHKILSDPLLEKRMGKASKQIIQQYSFDNMAQAFYYALEKDHIRKNK